MDIQQKKKKPMREEQFVPRRIPVTHINIRQSISILVVKVILLEFLSLFTFLFTCRLVNCGSFPLFMQIFSIVISGLKLTLFIYIIYQWLTEYYEITPEKIIHKRGLIFQRMDIYYFKHISAISYQQSLFGRLLNFGSITLHDWELEKNITLYLIHNPKKYYKLLKMLNPNMDIENKTIREKFILEDEKV